MRGKTRVAGGARRDDEIFLAVLATTSSISAVFVPVAFMKGMIGRFFFQFGLTVSFAVALSMLVSFTLTPMLSSRFLTAQGEHMRPNFVFRAMGRLLKRRTAPTSECCARALAHRWLIVGVAVASLVGAISWWPA